MPELCGQFASLLSPYLDGELAGTEHESLRDHLSICAACSKVVAEHESVKRRLLEARKPALSPDAVRTLLKRAREPFIPWFQLAAAIIVAALIPASFAVTMVSTPRHEDTCSCDVITPEIDTGL